MPTLPKFVSDMIIPFIKKGTVTNIQYHSKHFKTVSFKSDSLKNIRFKAGWEIEFSVSDTDMRHYTISAYDKKNGIVDVLFYLHQKGPGSFWASNLNINDKVHFMGPGKKISLDEQASSLVFTGDETTIGLYLMMQQRSRPNQQVSGAIEIQKEWNNVIDEFGLKLTTLSRTDNRGEALVNWLDENISSNDKSVFYLTGHAKTIQTTRAVLKSKNISSSKIITRPYWADGKTGL